ncbi:GNAT family N-acetyltransferase [Paenibacillus paridis]|uniref:GNAT family N-acetyltransferase n=1 Tax=Paenibacillus paridis TaxID=2583376 RepID=UPI00192E31ED|nr:GNAT family protein [Paenibacillus paridis]
MTTEPFVLQGARAKLILLEKHHAELLLKAAKDTPIWGVPLKGISTLADAEQYIEHAKKEEAAGTCIPYAIWDLEQDKIVGSTRFFDISDENRGLEIGYTWMNPSVWRTKINTECKYLLLREAFEQRGMIRVQLKADLRNTRSQAAIERIGAVKEGVLRNHRVLNDGYIRDTVIYSITNQEWPSVKVKLEAFISQ